LELRLGADDASELPAVASAAVASVAIPAFSIKDLRVTGAILPSSIRKILRDFDSWISSASAPLLPPLADFPVMSIAHFSAFRTAACQGHGLMRFAGKQIWQSASLLAWLPSANSLGLVNYHASIKTTI
jgi:hypothetical protein